MPGHSKTGQRVACRGCGQVYPIPYVYQHERKAHDIYGGSSGIIRADSRYPKGRHGPPAPVAEPAPTVIAAERPGVTYPHLGSYLQVRALALTDDGLVMHLANGAAVWQVRVTGHVAQ